MFATLTTSEHNRRRFLGSAAITLLAARLGIAGSARAQTTKEFTVTTALTAHSTAQDADAGAVGVRHGLV